MSGNPPFRRGSLRDWALAAAEYLQGRQKRDFACMVRDLPGSSRLDDDPIWSDYMSSPDRAALVLHGLVWRGGANVYGEWALMVVNEAAYAYGLPDSWEDLDEWRLSQV